VVIVGEVNRDSRRPVNANEDGQRAGGFVTAQHFVVQDKRKSAKRHDAKNGEAAMDPHQFSLEWSDLRELRLPVESAEDLKTGD